MATALGVSRQPAAIANLSRARESTTSSHDDGLSVFLRLRPCLFGIAYRMLGSAAEAEDIVQDVWVRWQTADRSAVRDAAAFLAAATTRLAINVLQSARSRRETCVGTWLEEPADTTDPGMGVERSEALELGVLALLEKLSPTERAAYVLREAFDYSYRDIANALPLEEANARQVVSRARQRVARGRRRRASSTEHRRVLESFVASIRSGDVAGLVGALCAGGRGASKRRQIPIGGGDLRGRLGRPVPAHRGVSSRRRRYRIGVGRERRSLSPSPPDHRQRCERVLPKSINRQLNEPSMEACARPLGGDSRDERTRETESS